MRILRPSMLPWIVLGMGVLFCLMLLLLVQADVFYSGDGGIKALQVKQFCQGEIGAVLKIPASDWVRDLWTGGLYPFTPPFVYSTSDGWLVAFPLLFPLLCLPFYKLIGYLGLYVIPMATLWILWLRFLSVAKSLGMPDHIAAVSLFVFIFSSPLTVYGAMFWEHTLGVMLAFCGMDFMITTRQSEPRSSRALAWGAVTGLAFWVRPEASLLLAGYGALGIFCSYKYRRMSPLLFVLGMGFSIAAFGLVNLTLYGHPLGLHGHQVLQYRPLLHRLGVAARTMFLQTSDLCIYLPVILFVLIGLLIFFLLSNHEKLGLKLPTETIQAQAYIAFTCLLFLGLVSFILPSSGGKQWGPRYLLVAVPGLCLLAGTFFWAVTDCTKVWIRNSLICFFSLLVALGAHKNSVEGYRDLKADYSFRVAPTLNFLRQHRNKCVGVTNQWIAMELQSDLEMRPYFLLLNDRAIEILATKLLSQGESSFFLVSHDKQKFDQEMQFRLDKTLLIGVQLHSVGTFGAYSIFDARLEVRNGSF